MPRPRISYPVRGIGLWVRAGLRIAALLILLANSSIHLKAQGRWQSFKALSGPERCWVVGHLWVAGKAQRVSARALALADSIRKQPYMDGNWNGGLVDAFRHSIWMAMMSQEIGAKRAEKLGKAHEKGNYRMWKKGKLEDGALADATATEMDLWNNGQGIAVAEELGDTSEVALVNRILNAMANGKMRVIKMDEAGRFLDEDGQVIPEEKWKGLWENPRCLAESKLVGDGLEE